MFYSYSPLLPNADEIRLFHLRLTEDDTTLIQGDLLNYSLLESVIEPIHYNALSYVWGDPVNTQPIYVSGCQFDVTENLHAALCSLRRRSIEWIWIDAICINQQNQQERGHQVRYMAKIYGKAYRVIVWLGKAADNSERVFEEMRARKRWIDASDNESLRQAVVALLERQWFRRIWILQEVAAARRILVVCGLTEIEGYSFCVGLKSLEVFYKAYPDLLSRIRSVNYLIRQANFRPTHGSHWSDMSFLTIRPLGELLDMFHTHEATERQDKVYALLGMSSDAFDTAELLPDYKLPWKEVFHRLIKFLLGEHISAETWDNKELATIKSRGAIIGRVFSVTPASGWGDTNKVEVLSRTAPGLVQSWSWSLHTSAIAIKQGDLIYLQNGAPNPSIIRLCNEHFAIVMITATPPANVLLKQQRKDSGKDRLTAWVTFLTQIKPSVHRLPLVWNWEKERPLVRDNNRSNLKRQDYAEDKIGTEPNTHLGKDNEILQMADVLQYLEELEEAEQRSDLAPTFLNQGRWRDAEEREVQMLEARMRVLGDEHPSTLASMNKLALTYSSQGWWKKAEEVEVQVVETTKRVLGNEHPNTLTSMGNLASTYSSQGRWREAEELEVQVMETTKRVLGDEHLDTLTSMGNLALTYSSQGRWREAEELEVQVMVTTKTVLGNEHPNALTSMNNLASTYRKQGRWKEAEELNVQVMETRKRVLGDEHPETLSSMANLASTFWNQGRSREAEKLEVQVMETRKRVLGNEHPDTLISMNNLASTYNSQGRWKEAEELNVQVMETRKRVLGDEHPDTLSSMANLATTYWNQGRSREAEKLGVHVMETRKRVLGDEHPDTLTSIANLASIFSNQGRWREAEEREVQVMETRKRVLGNEHPDTLTSMANLASTFSNQGRWRKAEEREVQVMKKRKRVLGDEHPDTLTSMNNLASTYSSQGRWKEAEELEVQVMETIKRVLGNEHPNTLTSINNLALTYRKQGRWKEAEELNVQVMEIRKRVLGDEHPDTLSNTASTVVNKQSGFRIA
ncbi:TPR-like protein [Ophiobolus disseminans]|uniref:TPR-like protein n=1 Tax=Ophiobolus disseminans TaxID=1469910 RepID=A0A6A6ZCJ2_9PLEO|nr:TPR-like protein [Ophiobolus disseminans]